jgi:hypothetical protein
VVRATWEEFSAGMRPGELEVVESFCAELIDEAYATVGPGVPRTQ